MVPKAQTFATCLSCMDGRVVLPVIQFIKEKHGVDFVDYISEAGMDGFLASHGPLDGILKKVDVSLQQHHSTVLYIVGHAGCAGHIVDDEQHRKDILSAIERIKTVRSVPTIGGLFVSKEWKVFPVHL